MKEKKKAKKEKPDDDDDTDTEEEGKRPTRKRNAPEKFNPRPLTARQQRREKEEGEDPETFFWDK